jgi:VanZ family protein
VVRALLVVVALILYGCLYPFHFHPLPPDGWYRFWNLPPAIDRFVLRDGLLNVLLYLPFGALAFLALRPVRNVWARVLLPVLFGLLLSTSIEILQLMDFPRTSSVLDVACNLAGTVGGIVAARAYSTPLLRIAARTQLRLAPTPSPPLLILCLWLGYQLFPLFPSIGLFAIRVKLRAFFTQWSFAGAAIAVLEWLVIAEILKTLLPGTTSRRYLAVLLLLLPARFFVLGRNLTSPELIGAVAACILWWYWLSNERYAAVILACSMVAAIVHLEVSPYHFSATPQPFSWIPFAAFIETGPDFGAVVFLRKSFWYGAAVWTLREAGAGYLKPTLGIALLLSALEWLQRYLPGRTPEITDPLLAILLALFLHFFQQYSESRSSYADGPTFYQSNLL